VAIPVLFKLTARVHFRGRQNDVFTPQQVFNLYQKPKLPISILGNGLPPLDKPHVMHDDSDEDKLSVDAACENGA